MVLVHHSFPRRSDREGKVRLTREREIAIGQVVLRLILEHGLILFPETLEIGPDPYLIVEGGSDRSFVKRAPVRACFTALTDDLDLHHHSDLFGSFSISVDVMEARSIGLVPTIYCYKPSTNDDGYQFSDGGLSYNLIHRLRDLHSVAASLAWIEAAADFEDERESVHKRQTLKALGIELEEGDQNGPPIENLDKELAREAYKFFPTFRPFGWELADSIEIVMSIFQLAESKIASPLDYYNQREWRIVRTTSEDGNCYPFGYRDQPPGVSPPPFSAQKRLDECLTAVTRAFEKIGEDVPDLQKASLVLGNTDRQFVSFVRTITVPLEADASARSTLNDLGIKFSASNRTIEGQEYVHFKTGN